MIRLRRTPKGCDRIPAAHLMRDDVIVNALNGNEDVRVIWPKVSPSWVSLQTTHGNIRYRPDQLVTVRRGAKAAPF